MTVNKPKLGSFSSSRLLLPPHVSTCIACRSTDTSQSYNTRISRRNLVIEQKIEIPFQLQNMSTSAKEHRSPNKLSRQKSFCVFVSFLGLFGIVVLVIQNQALRNFGFLIPSASASQWNFFQRWERLPEDRDCSLMVKNATARLSSMVEFLPLKDLRFSNTAMEGHTWFMSSLNDTVEGGVSRYIKFPSESTKGRLLCILGNDKSNGTRNYYALAWPDSLPHGAKLLRGLTIVSQTYYDYDNIWHGLSAIVPIVGWYKMKGCVVPERLVLYHWGELRTTMANWLQTIMDATFNGRVPIETLDRGTGPNCFEEAVVFRGNEGGMPKLSRRDVYGLMRCRARKYCNVTVSVVPGVVRMTLLFRTGRRSFKNDTAVVEIFKKECDKISGCQVVVRRPENMTFCDQVKLMTETDVVVSQHGAQLTNMIFMDRNSSVMEFFPKGWLERAGVGQYVFHWMADWAGMKHEGVWRDEKDSSALESKSLTFFKDRQIGHDEAYFANWTSKVLSRLKQYKLEKETTETSTGECFCGNH